MSQSQAEDMTVYAERMVGVAVEYAPSVVVAIVVLIVGLWIANRVAKAVQGVMEAKELTPSLVGFITNLFRISLKTLIIISVASMVGIETTSFIAVLGAAGLAIGLALQGSLSNLAGGVLIVIFNYYKVGDDIKTQGISGKVTEIHPFYTKLVTEDEKEVILPNGRVSNGIITRQPRGGV